MDESIETEIRELVESGNKIAAVKRYREVTGVGLAEAKDAVESLARSDLAPEQTRLGDSELTDEVVKLLSRGEKISAIKLYREQTGFGLREAKEAVERIGVQNTIPASSGGCLGVILLAMAVVAVLLPD